MEISIDKNVFPCLVVQGTTVNTYRYTQFLGHTTAVDMQSAFKNA